jgi:hypothetical protein
MVTRPFETTKLPAVWVSVTAAPVGVGHAAVMGMPESIAPRLDELDDDPLALLDEVELSVAPSELAPASVRAALLELAAPLLVLTLELAELLPLVAEPPALLAELPVLLGELLPPPLELPLADPPALDALKPALLPLDATEASGLPETTTSLLCDAPQPARVRESATQASANRRTTLLPTIFAPTKVL